ncbi:MAG: aminoacetone oxidase family FAD-binding enzyme [Clostridia bacterium]
MENRKEEYDLIVIGGGASGLTLGIIAKNRGKKVLVLEANERVGKKILATGNGKCNLSNAHIDKCNYNTELVEQFLLQQSKVCEYFDMLGLKTKLVDDRYYPYSESAKTVLNLLRDRLGNVHMLTDYRVNTLVKEKDLFIINKQYTAKKIAICTGSNANFGINSHNLLTNFGHSITKLYPSLVPLETDTTFIKKLNGLRAKVRVNLIDNSNNIVDTQLGEILFRTNGVSGIAIFMISSYLARNNGSYRLSIDFAPDLSVEDVNEFLNNNTIFGLLNSEIADSVVMQASSRNVDLCEVVKDFQLKDLKLGDIRNAQVVSGGVPLEEFDENLESKKCASLFACGEVLDVDGDCGGYNLNWAFLSAIIVGNII